MQLNLFEKETVSTANVPALYLPGFLNQHQSDWLFDYCQKYIRWEQKKITVASQTFDVPRLEALYGEEGCEYLYSGSVLLSPVPWTKPLLKLKLLIEQKTSFDFKIVLLNRYRTGNDSIQWHNDNEPSLGVNPAIASISVGGTRKFKLKNRTTKEVIDYELNHGDLLVMLPGCQDEWLHSIPKTKKKVDERISLTFRPFDLSSLRIQSTQNSPKVGRTLTSITSSILI